MKKFLVVAMMLCLAQGAFAGMWVGGQVSYDSTETKNEAGEKIKKTDSLTIAPEFGYNLDEKWDIGLSVLFGNSKDDTADVETNSWAVAPFARYNAVEYGKFALYFKGELDFGGIERKTAGNSVDADSIAIQIAPQLQYNLSDSFALTATLNFAALSYVHTSSEGDAESDTFGFNVNSENVLNTKDFQIGFIYKF